MIWILRARICSASSVTCFGAGGMPALGSTAPASSRSEQAFEVDPVLVVGHDLLAAKRQHLLHPAAEGVDQLFDSISVRARRLTFDAQQTYSMKMLR